MSKFFDFFKHYIGHPAGRFFRNPANLALWVAISLMAPNIGLNITEHYSFLSSAVNLLLPLGIYLLLMSAWKRVGITTWLMLPFMIFAGFEIVLLYLYGDSVIAVDMFLNVVTTNVSEATELLANLVLAMGLVFIFYLPPLIWGVVAICRKQYLKSGFRRLTARWGAVMTIAGVLCTGGAYLFDDNYNFVYETFPANAVSNLVEACHRYQETGRHEELAKDFSYHAVATHPADEREVYIFVVGETARGENWQLGGYGRATNPQLSKTDGVVFFPKSISESNTTHKSVPMLISFASAENFDSIASYRSIITAFREAGFHTAFISNQRRNRSYTEHFGNEADTTLYLTDRISERQPYDMEMLPMVRGLLTDTLQRKQLIVLHSYGSHFLYRDRYPADSAYFQPDNAVDASPANRSRLINAYDNTIRYTDAFLASLIGELRAQDIRSGLIYASDHGEDIFDDSRSKFLHASPKPTVHQIHQATLLWLSPRLTAEDPGMAAALRRNASRRISPQKSLFPSAMQMAGIRSPFVVDSLSLVSPAYSPAPPVYLDDLNRALPIDDCGLTDEDIKALPL